LENRQPSRPMAGQDEEERIIEDGVMKGSFENEVPLGSGISASRSVIWRVSWHLEYKPDVRAELVEIDPAWRPSLEPGQDKLVVKAKLLQPQAAKGKFKFILEDISKWPGKAVNYGKGEDLDMEFTPGQSGFGQPKQSGDSIQIETTSTSTEAQVELSMKDYAAWARLRVKVNVDGFWYDCLTPGGEDLITLPLDRDENYIADHWEEQKKVSGQSAKDDQDYLPEGVGDPKEPGDGYSNFEEYRGFMVKGKWRELDPAKKDLFICDLLGYGVGYFPVLGLELHVIDESEYDDKRKVNFNRHKDTTLEGQDGQCGIKLMKGDANGNYGQASTTGCPNVVEWCR
jgi:hypothetical protein